MKPCEFECYFCGCPITNVSEPLGVIIVRYTADEITWIDVPVCSKDLRLFPKAYRPLRVRWYADT